MAEEQGNQEIEKFDFTGEGEAVEYIRLPQAVIRARILARENDERYKERFGWGEVVWTELRSETIGEDYHRVVLQFSRPQRGTLEAQTGEEEFLFDFMGILQDRQVLHWPDGPDPTVASALITLPAGDEGNQKEEKSNFTGEGQAVEYITLPQAVIRARRLAREKNEGYQERFGWGEVVWTELRNETIGEDYYRVVLQFSRPQRGILEAQTGEEEFLFDFAGILQYSQVLLWPDGVHPGEGEVDTVTIPQPEGSALHPITPSSIAEALISPPAISHAETTEHRSELLSKSEEGGATVPVWRPSLPNTMGAAYSELPMVSLIDAIKLGFRNYFKFSKRSTRAEFWWWALFYQISTIVVQVFGVVVGADALALLFFLAILIPSFALAVRRLHDINRSGWWLLLWFAIFIGWIVLLVWAIRKGDEGPNRHGPDPRQATS